MIYFKFYNRIQLLKATILYLAVFALILVSTETHAQSNEKQISYRLDYGNRLFWRGEKYTESPIVQGIFGVQSKKLYFATAGVYATTPYEYHELNFIAEYHATDQFKIGIIDYFGLTDNLNLEHDFFNFRNSSTKHMLDLYLNYALSGNYPLNICWSTFLFGPDKNSQGKQRFSSYLELTLPFEMDGHTFNPYIGFSPYAGFYSDKPTIVTTGFKFNNNFIVNTNISLPSEIALILNPYKKKAYVSILIGIQNR